MFINKGNPLAMATALALEAILAPSAPAHAASPLVKSGACPELKREPFAMDDDFYARFAEAMNGGWMLKDNKGTIQSALDAQASINCAAVPAGLKAEMWADEKGTVPITSLQAFTFDERGRMWAVETFDYPNVLTDPFGGHDRIVILEDTDGDKVADRRTVFADKLNIPQGIEITPQGVVISMPPHLVLFEDRNGDDKPDAPQGKILYTGFNKANPGDTHGGIGSLRYGMDNWLYGESGYNGGNVKGVVFGPGVWRARMDGSRFEYFSPTASGNSWGLGFMEDGQVFASAANGKHSQQAVIPGVAAVNMFTNEENERINPITKDLVQGDWVGFFSAATDHEFYTARLFPQEYWNRAAFVSEGSGHLVNIDFFEPDKSSWKGVHKPGNHNLLASSDAWFAPIATRVGPDGGVWVLDWYTYIILHNGINCGPYGGCPGGAWPNPLRSRSRERIYRIVPADGKVDAVPDLSKAGYPQLVAALGHKNMFWRAMAQKMILRKVAAAPAERTTVEPMLIQALKSRTKDAVGIDGLALHALWTAEGLGLFTADAAKWDPILKGLLLHPSPAVRMNTARAMAPSAASAASIKAQGRVNDPDPYVRLWTLLALAGMPKTDGIRMWADFHNVDKWAQQAFTKANAGAGVTDAATLPAIPPLDSEGGSGIGPRVRPVLHHPPRFAFAGNVIHPLADWRLPAGDLVLTDMRGSLVGRSEYDGKAWSASFRARGEGLYLFTFTEAGNGSRISGLAKRP
ncbi:MAG: dehydrogenase [Fibrobacteres bacterium]|nr:dehydrogenase [Fibrobacterota bacterium]